MNKKINIITLGDIFENLETDEKAFEFLKYIKELQEENKKQKIVLDKIKEIILNHKDYKTEGLLVEETSNILELLEEIDV